VRQLFRTMRALVSILSDYARSGANAPGPPDGKSGTVPKPLLRLLIQQAADSAGVREDEVAVVVAESVTWRDGSLGCPRPGQIYTQALVPGYRVVLRVAGDEMAYHASESGDFRPCNNPMPPVDGPADR